MSSPIFPVIFGQWSRSVNDTVVVKLDQFKGTPVIDIRAWWKSPDGELRAGRSGITMSICHLPSLARSLTTAEVTALQLGLLAEPDLG